MKRLLRILFNRRGQLNLNQFVSPFLQGAGQAITSNLLNPRRLGTQVGSFLSNPRNLLGLGALGIGLNQPTEPGSITETRQAQRELAVNPAAFGNRLTGNVGAIETGLRPLFQQQIQRAGEDISQRFAAAFPGTVGAQGSEFGTFQRRLSDDILPNQQALLTQLGLQGIGFQNEAARNVLANRPGTSLGEQLGQFGGLLLSRDLLGEGNQVLDQSGNVIGSLNQQGQFLPGFGQTGQGFTGLPGFQQAASTLAQMASQSGGLNNLLVSRPDLISQVASIIGSQIVRDPVTGSLMATTSQGVQIPVDAINLQTLGAAPAAGGGAFQGILGAPGLSAQGIASGAGAAGLGFGAGTVAGPAFAGSNLARTIPLTTGMGEQGQAAVGGAVTGAAVGLALGGGPLGAIIGGLSGAFGGFNSQRAKEHAQKARLRSEDVARRSGLVEGIGAFWTDIYPAFGVDPNQDRIDSSTVKFARDLIDDLGFILPGGNEWVNQLSGQTVSQAVSTLTQLVPNDQFARIMVGAVMGQNLLRKLRAAGFKNAEGNLISNLNQIPGMKENYLSALTNIFSQVGERSDVNPFIQAAITTGV